MKATYFSSSTNICVLCFLAWLSTGGTAAGGLVKLGPGPVDPFSSLKYETRQLTEPASLFHEPRLALLQTAFVSPVTLDTQLIDQFSNAPESLIEPVLNDIEYRFMIENQGQKGSPSSLFSSPRKEASLVVDMPFKLGELVVTASSWLLAWLILVSIRKADPRSLRKLCRTRTRRPRRPVRRLVF